MLIDVRGTGSDRVAEAVFAYVAVIIGAVVDEGVVELFFLTTVFTDAGNCGTLLVAYLPVVCACGRGFAHRATPCVYALYQIELVYNVQRHPECILTPLL